MSCEEKKGVEEVPAKRVDIGILTIKPEEFEGVLDAFPDDVDLYVGPKSKRHYNLRSVDAGRGARYRVAIVRHVVMVALAIDSQLPSTVYGRLRDSVGIASACDRRRVGSTPSTLPLP